ncbi:PLP-dependent transferase [Saccharata proteae CBS 121410]|uniref:PLP-dependent transferase n=1 Tax=Saccharata proteae CBS 121410 TaxID=1314787 RepID=A0A9P4I2A9_9PEZI|nr:PLP-dependent transferase [Saccharata proteae CBS 121410]
MPTPSDLEPGPTPESQHHTTFTGYNSQVDAIRDSEYSYLRGKTYLDHSGATIYANSLVDIFCQDLKTNLYGNPHSASDPAELAGRRVDETREKALRFFNADPEHFDLVFVANASAAIKLINECFRDYVDPSNRPEDSERRHLWYGYHRDAHNSLVGVREAAQGCNTCFRNDEEVEDWIDGKVAFHEGPEVSKGNRVSLFAYPGQSNLNGRRLPLNWPGRIRRSPHTSGTYTFLDAAALASTAPLDFSDEANAPDFTCLSFYKIFGFPNIGALIVRKAAGHVLTERKFFGGGTVDMVICLEESWHAKKRSLHAALEDGTLPFHSIFALDAAITVHAQLFGSMQRISAHTAFLSKRMYDGMARLTHWNGVPICRIYKETSSVYGDPKTQGATVAFNIQHSDGACLSPVTVEQDANAEGIYLRSGSMCNPGGAAAYLGWSGHELHALYDHGHRCGRPAEIIQGKPIGVVRASLGAMSTISDVDNFVNFLTERYTDRIEDTQTPRERCHPDLAISGKQRLAEEATSIATGDFFPKKDAVVKGLAAGI